ncbi:ROK family protein [Dactylosporangium sp. NPDC048998]|uniref:ROK family transcriptional regulator n=1 Tax=Dactylosporangium sp. NPDC048998 TaxID=3363976 RepID=UPI003723E75E
MDAARPSLELLRSLTDEHVLRALMRHRRLTRAELAAQTGISKPTAGESVRRLAERGLVEDTGERTPGGRGKGRVGSYYALAPAAGTALAITIAPEGIAGEAVDAYGDIVARATRALDRPAASAHVSAALEEVAHELGPAPRLAVVSAADPVDRQTGRLVQLPDAPFLVGELDPVAVLTPHVAGPVTVDNDVNWAARAEREHAGDDFAYLYLGEGLGCAVVGDGEVTRGRTGLAGEIAHLLTAGPDGRAVPLIEVFGQLGLRLPGSTAIDAAAVPAAPDRRAIGAAVAGVVAAIVALADPGRVVVGGTWGPSLLDAIGAAVAELPRAVPLQAAAAKDPAQAGARRDALDRLRAAIVADAAQDGGARAGLAATDPSREPAKADSCGS